MSKLLCNIMIVLSIFSYVCNSGYGTHNPLSDEDSKKRPHSPSNNQNSEEKEEDLDAVSSDKSPSKKSKSNDKLLAKESKDLGTWVGSKEKGIANFTCKHGKDELPEVVKWHIDNGKENFCLVDLLKQKVDPTNFVKASLSILYMKDESLKTTIVDIPAFFISGHTSQDSESKVKKLQNEFAEVLGTNNTKQESEKRETKGKETQKKIKKEEGDSNETQQEDQKRKTESKETQKKIKKEEGDSNETQQEDEKEKDTNEQPCIPIAAFYKLDEFFKKDYQSIKDDFMDLLKKSINNPNSLADSNLMITKKESLEDSHKGGFTASFLHSEGALILYLMGKEFINSDSKLPSFKNLIKNNIDILKNESCYIKGVILNILSRNDCCSNCKTLTLSFMESNYLLNTLEEYFVVDNDNSKTKEFTKTLLYSAYVEFPHSRPDKDNDFKEEIDILEKSKQLVAKNLQPVLLLMAINNQ